MGRFSGKVVVETGAERGIATAEAATVGGVKHAALTGVLGADEASFVTGASYLVDGGYVTR